MVALVLLMVVLRAVKDWKTGKSAWFELGYDYRGECLNQCVRVGDKVSCMSASVDSKFTLEMSFFMVGVAVFSSK